MVGSEARGRWNGLLPAEGGDGRGQDAVQFGDDSDYAVNSAEPEYASVITQVNNRARDAKRPQQQQQGGPGAGSPGIRPASRQQQSWRARLQDFLCCFAPQARDQYYRPEPEAVLIRPPQPPVPPSHVGPPVLGPMHPQDRGKKTLVLDLDETLVHSSFKPVAEPDHVIPVEIEGRVVDVFVLKRPGMDAFLTAVGASFEVVVFTASLAKYADPLLDLLDPAGVVRWRLFRESCCPHEGNYVKNLLCLGRPLSDVIIVDNSPHSYVFQPDNALPIGTFIDDPGDAELPQVLQILQAVERVSDVRQHLGHLTAAMHSEAARRSL